MNKDGVFLPTAVLPLSIEYTVVAKWRSPVDGVAGLGGLTVQALCLSGYSHYLPPQPLAQLSLYWGAILWLILKNGNGTGTRKYYENGAGARRYYGNGAWTRKYYGNGAGTRRSTVRSLAWCLLLCCLGLRRA